MKSVGDLEDDIEQALEEDRFYRYRMENEISPMIAPLSVFNYNLLPTDGEEFNKENQYAIKHWSEDGNKLDKLLPLI